MIQKLKNIEKNIEKTVTGGYKRIENAAVSAYTRTEDVFVKSFLVREGESLDEAKKRLRSSI